MWSKLEEVFIEIGYPYSRQGSFTDNAEIPESTFTFWNISNNASEFYDNNYNTSIWKWGIWFYTKNPELIYSVMEDFLKKAKSKGFILTTLAADVPSDEANYFARYATISYIEKEANDG